MNGETFVHEGRSGLWTYTIYLQKSGEENFSATGDIVLHGQHRCKLVLCHPQISFNAGIDILKRQCIDWIEQAELEPDSKSVG